MKANGSTRMEQSTKEWLSNAMKKSQIKAQYICIVLLDIDSVCCLFLLIALHVYTYIYIYLHINM